MLCAVGFGDKGFGVFGALVLALRIGLGFGAVQGSLIFYIRDSSVHRHRASRFFVRGATTMVEVKPRPVQNEAFQAL
jgi:simple sugar transport system permease protein